MIITEFGDSDQHPLTRVSLVYFVIAKLSDFWFSLFASHVASKLLK